MANIKDNYFKRTHAHDGEGNTQIDYNNLLNTPDAITTEDQTKILAVRTSAQTMTNAAYTTLTFNTVTYDTLSEHTIANGRTTVTEDGLYLFICRCGLPNSNGGSRRLLDALVNGGSLYERVDLPPNQYTKIELSFLALLSAGDYVTFRFYQDHGSNRSGDTNYQRLHVLRLREDRIDI